MRQGAIRLGQDGGGGARPIQKRSLGFLSGQQLWVAVPISQSEKGTAEQLAEKVPFEEKAIPQHLKPNSFQGSYGRPNARCGEAGPPLQQKWVFPQAVQPLLPFPGRERNPGAKTQIFLGVNGPTKVAP